MFIPLASKNNLVINMIELTQEVIVVLVGLVLAELLLLLIALNDLRKQQFENKMIWFFIIVFISTFGPILYFLIAPRESTGLDFESD